MKSSKPNLQIPVLDLGGYLAGKSGELERLAAEMRNACQNIGFYFVKNHSVDANLVDAVFKEAERFHAQPIEEKLKLKFNEHSIGYIPLKGETMRNSTINKNDKANLNETYFVKRDLAADHPDVVAKKLFRPMNMWPDDLPGFRETVNAYAAAMERLALSLLPIYATALGAPADAFDAAFKDPQYTLRLTHYPQQKADGNNEFGVAPHTDTSFMTLLAQNHVAGLAIQLTDGSWIDAPALPDTFLVNGGDLLRRWTNNKFLATPHKVVNRSGRERYAIPYFFDCHVDHVIMPLESCLAHGEPPAYPPITYTEYLAWYRNRNYDVLKKGDSTTAKM